MTPLTRLWDLRAMTPAVWKVQSETPLRKAQVRFYCQPCADEVQNDFEIICFDLVWSPSTPGAYLFLEPNDRFNFEENLEEENKMKSQRVSDESSNKSLDLMKKLNDYLKY